MAVLVSKAWVEIGGVKIDNPARVHVVSSRRDFDYAEVELYGSGDYKGKEIKVYLQSSLWGQACVLWGKVEKALVEGHLIKLKAYDWLYFTKDMQFDRAYSGKVSMDRIVRDALGFNLKTNGEFARLSNFVADNTSVRQIIEYAKRDGKDLYQLPGTREVYYGIPFGREDVREFHYRIGYNVISSSLKFKKGENVGKVVVWLNDSQFRYKSVKGEYGRGEPVRTFHFSEDVSDVAEAKRRAAEKARDLYWQLNSDRYEGYMEVFGNPMVRHSDKVFIEDPTNGNRTGHYFIDKVEHEFSYGYTTRIYIAGGGL